MNVRFCYSDGCEVAIDDDSQLLKLRSPMSLILYPGDLQSVNLGLRCISHNLLAFPASWLVSQKIEVNVDAVVRKDSDVTVLLKNHSDVVVILERGDTLVNACVLHHPSIKLVHER